MSRGRKTGLPEKASDTGSGTQTPPTSPARGRKALPRAAFSLPPEFIARIDAKTRHTIHEILAHGEILFQTLFLPKLEEHLKEDARQRLENDDQGAGPHAPNLEPDGSGEWIPEADANADNGGAFDPSGKS